MWLKFFSFTIFAQVFILPCAHAGCSKTINSGDRRGGLDLFYDSKCETYPPSGCFAYGEKGCRFCRYPGARLGHRSWPECPSGKKNPSTSTKPKTSAPKNNKKPKAQPPKTTKNPSLRGNSFEVSIMSYNLYGWNALGTEKHIREHNLYSIIKDRSPDFVGAQETAQEVIIANRISTSSSGPYEAVGDYRAGLTIFYKRRNWELLSTDYHGLSERDQWGQRFVLFARFRHKTSRKLIDIFNTHFCAACSDYLREQSARSTMTFINRKKDNNVPYILMGDINCGEGCGANVEFRKHMLDVFRIKHPNGNANTFGGVRLDYVYASKNVNVKDAYVHRNQPGPASDHLATGGRVAI